MRHRLALALVLLVLLSACTADVRIDPGRARTTGQPIASPSVPSRELLGPGVRWRARATPIGYGNGLVVVGDETGVSAYGLRCRRPCEPAFTARLDTPGSALVHRHIAYVGTDHGVAILSLRCSGSCHPVGWLRSGGVAEPAFDGYANPPNSYIPVGVAGGLVLAPRIGRLEAFPAGCATPRCAPAWRGVLYRRPSITWTETPVVAGGLAIASTRGCVCGAEGNVPRIEAFPLSCGTDGTTCEPAWSTTFPGTRFNSGLVVHDGLAYLVVDGLPSTKASAGLGYPVDCAGRCKPTVRLDLGRAETGSGPVFAGGSAFVLTRSPNRLLAFEGACTGSCRSIVAVPLPRAGLGPFVAPGSVLVAAGRDLIAYPLDPRADGWRRSWTWRAPFRIEDVRVRRRFAIVSAHNRSLELDLHALD
jgi:hypothetical protein